MSIPAKSGITLSGHEYLNQQRPMIYIWKRGAEYLYIGYSAKGIRRIYERDHHIFQSEPVLRTDTITMMFYDSTKGLQNMERALIKEYKPKYNKMYLVYIRQRELLVMNTK